MAVLPSCCLDLDIKLLLVEYLEAFLVLAYYKTNYHLAFSALKEITTESGVSRMRIIDFSNLRCFQGKSDYLFNSYCVWFAVLVISKCMCFFNDIKFVCIIWRNFSNVIGLRIFSSLVFLATTSAEELCYCIILCISH